MRKKEKDLKLEGNCLFPPSLCKRPAGLLLSVHLGSLGWRANSHIRKGKSIVFGSVSKNMDPQELNVRKNTPYSVVKQNDSGPCFQKDCFNCFDVPKLNPLFSWVVILSKKRNDVHGDGEVGRVGAWWGNGMGCEDHRNKSGPNYFLWILGSNSSYHQYGTLDTNIWHQIFVCFL